MARSAASLRLCSSLLLILLICGRPYRRLQIVREPRPRFPEEHPLVDRERDQDEHATRKVGGAEMRVEEHHGRQGCPERLRREQHRRVDRRQLREHQHLTVDCERRGYRARPKQGRGHRPSRRKAGDRNRVRVGSVGQQYAPRQVPQRRSVREARRRERCGTRDEDLQRSDRKLVLGMIRQRLLKQNVRGTLRRARVFQLTTRWAAMLRKTDF